MEKYSYLSTGLSSGIGGAARPRIESSHPELHHIMLCRDPHKFSSSKNTTAIKVDLESIESVRNALVKVKTLLDDGNVPPLKYILNNAGAQYESRAIKTREGYEVTFQVNVIAPFLIISAMLPYLRKVQQPRVFVTGSFVHFADDEHAHGWVPPIYWNDNDVRQLMLPHKTGADPDPAAPEAGKRANAISKLAVIYLVHEFARSNQEVKFVVYHPGYVASSGLYNNMDTKTKIVIKSTGWLCRLMGWATTVSKAGANLAKNAFDEHLYANVKNVAYVDQGEITRSSDESYNEKREQKLWNELVKVAEN
ncbi:hypothetical protein JA9_003429 [Meyerozyma sp. JA9]|nr:hypothetical protein JA9_003429 [Meyerozyma sp. JA9]